MNRQKQCPFLMLSVTIFCLMGVAVAFSVLPISYVARLSHQKATGATQSSKWDDLVDDDDEEPDLSIPTDMLYIPRNVVRQNQNFVAIREAGGTAMTNDVYLREPNSNVFWFCGKVARVSDVTLDQAIARQWPIIEEHAANLRRLELYPHKGFLEVWTAPGDSEMDVVYNNPNSIFQKMDRNVEGANEINKTLIGFQGEMYDPGEEGFRTLRTDDGRPLKPEIVVAPDGGTTAPAGTEDLERLMETMKGMDLTKLYEEQERREGRDIDDEE